MVGKSSGVYITVTANAPEIPSFPIMLNVTRKLTSVTSPANITAKHKALLTYVLHSHWIGSAIFKRLHNYSFCRHQQIQV